MLWHKLNLLGWPLGRESLIGAGVIDLKLVRLGNRISNNIEHVGLHQVAVRFKVLFQSLGYFVKISIFKELNEVFNQLCLLG